MTNDLESLKDAYRILDNLLGKVAREPSPTAFRFMRDARDHVQNCIDLLEGPGIFEQCRHGKAWAMCETCRGWSEHSRLAHIYGAENV